MIRFILAMAVVAGHVNADLLGLGSINRFYAVQAFFIISGFYMAMVLNQGYQGANGRKNFYATRALRIFPMYFVGVSVAFFANYLAHGSPFSVEFFSLTWVSQIYYIVANIFIVGLELSYIFCFPTTSGGCSSEYLQWVIPAWSIGAELAFYAIAPFIVRSQPRTVLLLFAGVGYLVWTTTFSYDSASWPLRPIGPIALQYFALPSTWMFFALGALAHQLSARPIQWSVRTVCTVYSATIAMLLAMSYTTTIMPWWHAVFFAAALPALFAFFKMNRLDRMIGDLSYPIYILHHPIYTLTTVLGLEVSLRPSVSAIATLGLSIMAVLLVDRPLEKWRHRHFSATAKPEP